MGEGGHDGADPILPACRLQCALTGKDHQSVLPDGEGTYLPGKHLVPLARFPLDKHHQERIFPLSFAPLPGPASKQRGKTAPSRPEDHHLPAPGKQVVPILQQAVGILVGFACSARPGLRWLGNRQAQFPAGLSVDQTLPCGEGADKATKQNRVEGPLVDLVGEPVEAEGKAGQRALLLESEHPGKQAGVLGPAGKEGQVPPQSLGG